MVYTLIERDCQANPAMVEAGLRTTDEVLNVLGGFCVSVHLMPSGYEVFWPDTPTEKQKLIWRQLQVSDPGTRMPDVRPASQEAGLTPKSASFESEGDLRIHRANRGSSHRGFGCSNLPLVDGPAPQIWIGKVLIATYLFCYAENEIYLALPLPTGWERNWKHCSNRNRCVSFQLESRRDFHTALWKARLLVTRTGPKRLA